MSEKLKRCPFCNSEAWLHSDGGVFRRSGFGHRVECEGSCHSMTCYWHTKDEAIKWWNTRWEK